MGPSQPALRPSWPRSPSLLPGCTCYSASPPQSSRPSDFSPAKARSPLDRCPALRTEPKIPEPVFCSAPGHAGRDRPGQGPRARTRRGVSRPPWEGAGRAVGRGRHGWGRTAVGPRARIRRGHLSHSVPAPAAGAASRPSPRLCRGRPRVSISASRSPLLRGAPGGKPRPAPSFDLALQSRSPGGGGQPLLPPVLRLRIVTPEPLLLPSPGQPASLPPRWLRGAPGLRACPRLPSPPPTATPSGVCGAEPQRKRFNKELVSSDWL